MKHREPEMRFLILTCLCFSLLAAASCSGPGIATELNSRQTAEGSGLDPYGGKGASGGACIDPNGREASQGSGIDPNGRESSYTACIDPNGRTVSAGSAMDPNGEDGDGGEEAELKAQWMD